APEAPAARPAAASGSPAELLRNVEEVQRKEVAALKAMVELLIEKGVFSREEYLAKVKR
ncbi:general secretion pathway protein GspE, partial [Myxococcus xanthus]|nr:general secretion pathway protein GspE [Myxococcus xanthus]